MCIRDSPKTQFYSVDVRGEVAFGCENLGFKPADIERQVDAAAREFDLAPLIDESLFSLSGGQKQRVACASAEATSPALVVLDEPSSNLDFEAIAQLRSAIARWKAEGIAVLVAEHRIHYLEGIADHVLYLDNGRIDVYKRQECHRGACGHLEAHMAERRLFRPFVSEAHVLERD